MNVAVLGGAGFIGSHIAEHWLARGAGVLCFDNLSTGRRENVPPGAGWCEGDICSAEDLRTAFRIFRPEVVYHEAAQMDVRKSVDDPMFDALTNIGGSVRVLQACVEHGVRKVVYASTGGAVYGQPQFLPITEDHPINPACPYGISKHTVEHYLALWKDLYGLDYTVLRYPNVYGPRQNPHGEAGVVSIFTCGLRAVYRGVTVFGSGDETRDYVHVSDVAWANVLAATSASGQIVNIGSGIGTSTKQILAEVAGALSVSVTPEQKALRPGEVQHIALDATRARELLGWEPTIGIEQGIKETVEYIIRNEGI